MELTEKFFMEVAGWKAMKEARALLASRKVISASWKPPILKGMVEAGGRTYSSGLAIKNPKDIENLCRCRESQEWGTICHHSVAVALEVIRKNDFASGKLAQKNQKSQEEPSKSTGQNRSKTSQKNIPFLKRTDIATAENVLSLELILPPNWLKQCESNKGITISLFANQVSPNASRIPLGNVETQESWYLDELDSIIVTELETLGVSELPSHLPLNSDTFLNLFSKIPGHENTFTKDGVQISIDSRPWIPRCSLSANDDGSLSLKLIRDSHVGNPTILMGPPPSVFIDETIRPISPAASQWDWNKEEHIISRGKISQFLNTQWPALEETGQVKSKIETDLFDVKLGAPIFHLELEGGLATLKGRIRCQYGRAFYTISKNEIAQLGGSASNWIADPDRPFKYWSRNIKAEKEALSLLFEAGFYQSTDGETIELKSQDRVLPFLATTFQQLKKKNWVIELESRLEKSISNKTETIAPTLDFLPSGEDWFEMQIKYSGSKGSRFSESEVQDLLRSGRSYRKKPDGKIVLIDAPLLEEFHEVVRDCSPNQSNKSFKFEAQHASFLMDSIEETTSWKMNGNVDKIKKPKLSEKDIPQALNKILRDYQKDGALWMTGLRQNNLGGILADDMGLGKTLQTLAFIKISKMQSASTNSAHPTLIICPTSLVHNWQSEIQKFVPDLKSLIIHGSKRHDKFKLIPDSDIVITSLPLIQRDLENYKDIKFESVFIDEAQNIKNPGSKVSKAVRKLKSQFRIALSGTPVENRVMDLWSIMDFVMPGYLGPQKEFQSRYELPIAKLKDKQVADRLRRRVSPFILRRLKTDVAKELPERLEQIHFCEMSPEQSQFYHSILQESRNKIFDSVESSGFGKNKILIFQTLMRLRQICCDLRLLGDDARFEKSRSSKFELLEELISEAIDGNHKILVFSQFTSMLDLLTKSADENNIGYSLLTGKTQNRQKVIQEFKENESKNVFFISLKAGGTGLNLTEADIVIHYDPWWNPAVEDQATSRAHRIGQSKVVSSYKLITKNTIEEKILHLQGKKRDIFKTMVDGSAKMADSLSWDEVQDLLDAPNH